MFEVCRGEINLWILRVSRDGWLLGQVPSFLGYTTLSVLDYGVLCTHYVSNSAAINLGAHPSGTRTLCSRATEALLLLIAFTS